MIFTAREHKVLQALAERLFPRDPRFPVSGADLDFAPAIERFFANVGPSVTNNLKRAIFVFDRGAHFSRLTHRSFRRLKPEDQDAYVRAWAESSLYPRRLLFTGLKMVLTMVYTSHPGVERAVGYDPTGSPLTPLTSPRSRS